MTFFKIPWVKDQGRGVGTTTGRRGLWAVFARGPPFEVWVEEISEAVLLHKWQMAEEGQGRGGGMSPRGLDHGPRGHLSVNGFLSTHVARAA